MTGPLVRSPLGRLVLAAVVLLGAAWTPAAAAPIAKPSVIGGKPSPEGRWPFVVGLLAKSVPDSMQAQFCAGSLVRPRIVLTAAHCVEGLAPTDLDILVGTHDLGSGGRRLGVTRIVIHPSYDTATSDYDVALVRLAEPVRGIRPVRMIGPVSTSAARRPGSTAITMGWGDIAPGDAIDYPTLLHEAGVRLVSRASCNAAEAYAGAITPRMLCAGMPQGGRDSCQGDSGGPLMARDRTGRFRVQIGIVSWGNGCALARWPGVYSDVRVLGGWIRRTLATL